MPTLSENLDGLTVNRPSPSASVREVKLYCDQCVTHLTDLYVQCKDCMSRLCSDCHLSGEDCPTGHTKIEFRIAKNPWLDADPKPTASPSRSEYSDIDEDFAPPPPPPPAPKSRDPYRRKFPKDSRFGSELSPSDSVSQVGASLDNRRSSRNLKKKSSRVYERERDRIYV